MFDIFDTKEASAPAYQQWLDTVSRMFAELGWPGEVAHLILIAFAVIFFLVQLKRFVAVAFFSESGLRARGQIVSVADSPGDLTRAEIAFIAHDGRRYLFGHRARYAPGDRGRAVEVLYAPTNPQRAIVRQSRARPTLIFVVSTLVALACAGYGLSPLFADAP